MQSNLSIYLTQWQRKIMIFDLKYEKKNTNILGSMAPFDLPRLSNLYKWSVLFKKSWFTFSFSNYIFEFSLWRNLKIWVNFFPIRPLHTYLFSPWLDFLLSSLFWPWNGPSLLISIKIKQTWCLAAISVWSNPKIPKY